MAEHVPTDGHHEYHSHASMYVKVWAVLLVLLAISIAGPMLEVWWITLITAFGIATVKAGLVIRYFMHMNDEPKVIWYILTTSIAFVLLFFFAVAPDVMNHDGTRWENVASKAFIEKKMAEGDPADHHGGDHGDEHAPAGDHAPAGEHKEAPGGH